MSRALSMSLDPIDRVPTDRDLSHLLGRCLFGVSPGDISHFRGMDIMTCLDIILTPSPEAHILAQEDPDMTDPLVSKGEDWISAPYENDEIDLKRRIYLRAWWMGQIINRDYSLTEKMTLFWHNHFVTEMDAVRDARYSYLYISLLRSQALGSFKKLIQQGTVNPAMLVYLNGNSNNKNAPNENYSRELLELFTLGKGPDIKYTEDDIKALARVLTGWRDDKDSLRAAFSGQLHDTGDKHFSSFFDHTCIRGRTGADGAIETQEAIDMIFRKKETSKYLCRNLYRWFVCSDIDAAVEDSIITPLSDILVAHDFEVAPVLRKLLGSRHFFDTAFTGSIIKNPIEFWIGAFHQFGLTFPSVSSESHLCWIYYSINLGGLMLIGDPPSVSGWPAYYQSPKFDRWWINSYTLAFRMTFIDSLLTAEGLNCNGPKLKFDFTAFLKHLTHPEDPDHLIDHSIASLLAVGIGVSDRERLKALLTPGHGSGPDWTTVYRRFIDDPSDVGHKDVVEARLKSFFRKIISLPEYQLM